MANEGYHEPINEISDETRDMHCAITSLMEELEAGGSEYLIIRALVHRPLMAELIRLRSPASSN